MNQLISITHSIFSAFDVNPSLKDRGNCFGFIICIASVWHESLLYELKNSGINGNLLDLIKSFLHDRHQNVVLRGQSSISKLVKAGVSQASVL